MSQNGILAGEAYVKLSVESSGLEEGLQRVQQACQQWTAELNSVANSAGFVGDRLLSPIKASIGAFKSFDDAMLMVHGILGDVSNEGFAALTEKAKELGRTTSWTSEEVATGMIAIARSTGSLEDTSNMITGVMNAARATGTMIDTTADFAVNTMRQFGLSSEDSSHVLDVMVKTANSSAQTFEDLGWALSQCGSICKASGYSLEQTTTVLGLLANVGIKGTAAGTSLKNMLVRLQKPSEEVKDALAEIGLQPFDDNGQLRPLEEIFGDLMELTDGMELKDKNRIFAELFGLRALPGASGLASVNPDDLKAMAEAVMAANGAAAQTAELMDSGIGGSLRLLDSALDGIKQAIAEGVVPELKKLIDNFTPLLTKVAEFIKEHPQLVMAVGGLGAAFTGLKLATFGIGQVLQTISAGLSAVVGTANLFSKINIAAAAKGLSAALSALGTAGVIGGVVAVSVGVLALANNLFSAQAQAKKLNEELANMTGENNKIRKEDFQKYNALIALERGGEMSAEQVGIARSALDELTKTYGDLGIQIEGNRVVGASAGFEGFKQKVSASYKADIQTQRDALGQQIKDQQWVVDLGNRTARGLSGVGKAFDTLTLGGRGRAKEQQKLDTLLAQDAALAQQQSDADIFFATALGGTKQETYEQLAVGAGGGMGAEAIQSAIQSGVAGISNINLEAPTGAVTEAGADAADTAKATEETAKQVKRSNDYLQIVCENTFNTTPTFSF